MIGPSLTAGEVSPVRIGAPALPAMGARARRIALCATAASLTGTCALGLLFAIWPVEPRVTFWDNGQYYFPSQAKIIRESSDSGESSGPSIAQLLLRPFFRPVGIEADVLAHEAKPVYLVALRLWGMAYRAVCPGAEFPSAWEYTLFVALTAWWLGNVTWLVGDRLGHPRVGLLAGVILIVNPWQVNYLYLPHYTQFSTALLMGAFLSCLAGTPRGAFAAGIVGSLALLSNNALLVYLPGLAVAAGFLGLPGWRKAIGCTAACVAGMLAVFAFFGALAHTEKVRQLCADDVISPWTMLYRYYQYSLSQNHFAVLAGLDHTPKYPGMFFEILGHVSLVWLAAFIAAPLGAAWFAFRRGGDAALRTPWLRGAIALLLVAVPAVGAIEFGPGVQLGRAYFPAVPFCLLAAGLLIGPAFERLADSAPRRRLAWTGAACVALYYAGEFGTAFIEQHRAFHETAQRVAEYSTAGGRLLFLRGDQMAHEAYASALLENGGVPFPGVGWAEVERGAEPLVQAATAGRALLLSGVPGDERPRGGIPTPRTVTRWLDEMRSGQGPVVAELIDYWPRGRFPYVLVRYEDEYFDWQYRVGRANKKHLKLHVWKLTPRSDYPPSGLPPAAPSPAPAPGFDPIASAPQQLELE